MDFDNNIMPETVRVLMVAAPSITCTKYTAQPLHSLCGAISAHPILVVFYTALSLSIL